MTDRSQLLAEFIENQFFFSLLHHLFDMCASACFASFFGCIDFCSVRANIWAVGIWFYFFFFFLHSIIIFRYNVFNLLILFIVFVQLLVGHMRSKVNGKSGHCFSFNILIGFRLYKFYIRFGNMYMPWQARDSSSSSSSSSGDSMSIDHISVVSDHSDKTKNEWNIFSLCLFCCFFFFFFLIPYSTIHTKGQSIKENDEMQENDHKTSAWQYECVCSCAFVTDSECYSRKGKLRIQDDLILTMLCAPFNVDGDIWIFFGLKAEHKTEHTSSAYMYAYITNEWIWLTPDNAQKTLKRIFFICICHCDYFLIAFSKVCLLSIVNGR